MARRSTASLGSSVGAPCTWQRKPSSAYLSARTMPDLASRSDASTSCALLPMDETMPIPVTTTRLIFASSLYGTVLRFISTLPSSTILAEKPPPIVADHALRRAESETARQLSGSCSGAAHLRRLLANQCHL